MLPECILDDETILPPTMSSNILRVGDLHTRPVVFADPLKVFRLPMSVVSTISWIRALFLALSMDFLNFPSTASSRRFFLSSSVRPFRSSSMDFANSPRSFSLAFLNFLSMDLLTFSTPSLFPYMELRTSWRCPMVFSLPPRSFLISFLFSMISGALSPESLPFSLSLLPKISFASAVMDCSNRYADESGFILFIFSKIEPLVTSSFASSCALSSTFPA